MHSEVGVRMEKPPFGEEAFAGWLVYPDLTPAWQKKSASREPMHLDQQKMPGRFAKADGTTMQLKA
jgi:hypothetical protein